MGAYQTSSTMPSIGADRSSGAAKVQPCLLLSYSLVASTKPLCCLCRGLLPQFTVISPSPIFHLSLYHHCCPPVTGVVCQDTCHRLQECMLGHVFPVSHTDQKGNFLGVDISLVPVFVFTRRMAKRALETFMMC